MAVAILENAVVVILQAFNAHSTSGQKYCGKEKGSGSGCCTGFMHFLFIVRTSSSLAEIYPSSTIPLSPENKEDSEVFLRFKEGVMFWYYKLQNHTTYQRQAKTYLIRYIHYISTTSSINLAQFLQEWCSRSNMKYSSIKSHQNKSSYILNKPD